MAQSQAGQDEWTDGLGARAASGSPGAAGAYADPVDVQRRAGDPTAFLWRGRVFVVQGVRAHWVETGPWWRSASVRALLAGGPARDRADDRAHDRRADDRADDASRSGRADRASRPDHAGRPAGDDGPGRTDRTSEPVGAVPGATRPGAGPHRGVRRGEAGVPGDHADPGAPALDAGEREFWQVEAAAGRQDVPGVYELCHDWTAGATGGWSLTRTAG